MDHARGRCLLRIDAILQALILDEIDRQHAKALRSAIELVLELGLPHARRILAMDDVAILGVVAFEDVDVVHVGNAGGMSLK